MNPVVTDLQILERVQGSLYFKWYPSLVSLQERAVWETATQEILKTKDIFPISI